MSIRPSCLAVLALLALHGCSPAPSDPASSTETAGMTLAAPGPVTLVRDLNPEPVIRQPVLADEFVRMGNHVYFTASGAGLGRELWRTDGTPEGTTLVRDIIPGSVEGSPSRLTVWKDRLYFVVPLPWGGLTLYVSDGTAAGTFPHAFIVPEGKYGADAESVRAVFATRNGVCLALMATEPQDADAILCAQEAPNTLIRIPGPWEQRPEDVDLAYFLFGLDGVVYFDVDSFGRYERWQTDGTPEGTSRFFVHQLPGLSSGAHALTSFHGAQYFRGGDTDADRSSLWRTDGTPGGTVRVTPLAGPSNCACGLTPAGDTLWMPTHTPETGVELWKSDGTAEGTVFVKDLAPGTASSNPHGFVQVGALTLFWANSPEGTGLWRTDGTAEGTVFVKAAPTSRGGQVVDGVYYYQTAVGPLALELWRTDGTAEGTAMVKHLSCREDREQSVGLSSVAEVNGTFLFRGLDVQDYFGPWRSDGTEAGTRPLLEIPGTSASTPTNLAAIGSRVYFLGRGPGTAYGVWSTDGTAEGTVALAYEVSRFTPLPMFGGTEGRVFFVPLNAEVGQELWVTDGTPAGTRLVKDIWTGVGGSLSTPRVFLGDALYFTAAEKGQPGRQLWRTDGTPENTWPLRTLLPGGLGQAWGRVVAVGDTVYFNATTPDAGMETWRTDGTPEGTHLLGDFTPGTAVDGPLPFAAVGNTLYLFQGSQLWKSDGTFEGTHLVEDIGRTDPMEPVVVGNTLYFILPKYALGGTLVQGYLWKTDGTPEGTVQVRGSGYVEQPAAMGGALYFFEEDPVGSFALWRTDGTEAGTWRVKALPRVWWNEGAPLSTMLAVEPEGRLIFAAADGAGGVEPWVSDGTPEGTGPLQDLYPGTPGSRPYNFVRMGDHVYFAANDGTHGLELFKVPVSKLNPMKPGDNPGPDAGTEVDAGTDAGTESDAGTGTEDDAGTWEDAGTIDAGTTDAGTQQDAGTADAGTESPGPADAGPEVPGPDTSESGCGCGATSVGAPWLMLVFGAWMGRRRRA